jgi:hypothetical protein
MTKIDDTAILMRAKELCAEAGIAWDRFTETVPETPILNDRERRECLMRARNELVREAFVSAAVSGGQSADHPDVAESPVDESTAFWPRRRAA